MTDPQVGMLMLGLFIFIIMLGFPIAFTLVAMGVGFGYYAYYTPGQEFFANRVFTLLVQKTFEVTSSDTLVAVPLFLFMGYLIERANVLDRLFYLPSAFHEERARRSGGGHAGDVRDVRDGDRHRRCGGHLMGLLALPAMLRAGYDVKLSAGVVCAGGCLGILIPPSILLIVYAATAGVSAVKLYAAAFLPGFLLAGPTSCTIVALSSIPSWLRSCPRNRPTFLSARFSTRLPSFLPLDGADRRGSGCHFLRSCDAHGVGGDRSRWRAPARDRLRCGLLQALHPAAVAAYVAACSPLHALAHRRQAISVSRA